MIHVAMLDLRLSVWRDLTIGPPKRMKLIHTDVCVLIIPQCLNKNHIFLFDLVLGSNVAQKLFWSLSPPGGRKLNARQARIRKDDFPPYSMVFVITLSDVWFCSFSHTRIKQFTRICLWEFCTQFAYNPQVIYIVSNDYRPNT